MPQPTLLTSPQVSNLLGVSLRTVHRLVSAGTLTPAMKLPGPNGAFLYNPRDVERLVAKFAAEKTPAAESAA